MTSFRKQLLTRLADYPYLDPNSVVPVKQTALLISVWIGTTIAAVFTILRSWLQFRHNKRWFTNDYLLGLALALHVALSITITCMTPSLYRGLDGVARAGSLNEHAINFLQPSFLKYQFAALIQLWTTLWVGKMAMLSFYWRLFNAIKTKARLLWWIIFGFTIATFFISIILQAVAADPPSQPFNPGVFVKPQSLAGFNRAFHFAAISDILTDITIMIVPLPLLRILRLPRSQKAVLLFIFLTPLFAIFFAILNVIFESIKTLGPTINPIRLLMFSTLEISLFIIIACLPSLRLYFKDRGTLASHSTSSKETSPNPRCDGRRSIDWGSMVMRPIMSARSRPVSQPVSMDQILTPGSQEARARGVVDGAQEAVTYGV